MFPGPERSPRFALHLPLRFFSVEGIASGTCLNISKSGMLVRFDQPVELWLVGTVSVSAKDMDVELTALVARTDGHNAGLSYRIHGEADRLAVRRLLAFAVESNHECGNSVAA